MIAAKKQRGRPALPPEAAQTAMIRERVTEAQWAEYEARGGKAALIAWLGRKQRPRETNAKAIRPLPAQED